MLVLSRKPFEAVVINGDITVTVVEIRNGKVRLGFSAPESVPINRKEVQDAINNGSDQVKFVTIWGTVGTGEVQRV